MKNYAKTQPVFSEIQRGRPWCLGNEYIKKVLACKAVKGGVDCGEDDLTAGLLPHWKFDAKNGPLPHLTIHRNSSLMPVNNAVYR